MARKRKGNVTTLKAVSSNHPEITPRKLKVTRNKKERKWILQDALNNQKLGENAKLGTLLEIAKTFGVIVHCPDDIKKNVEEMTRLA